MRNKLSLAESSLTVTTETVETDHMTLRTLEDQNHVPERRTDRQTGQSCRYMDTVCVCVCVCVCVLHDVGAGDAGDVSAVGHYKVEGHREVVI